jgi:antitoxin component YwqK of YwqJK toxin-antitoxin module
MDDVILNHLVISSRKNFLSISNSIPPFILKGNRFLFDVKNYYFQDEDLGTIFINGEREGLQFGWFKNGNKWFETSWKNGKQDGPEIIWRKNGNMKYEVTWKDGKQNGSVTEWDENGKKRYSE